MMVGVDITDRLAIVQAKPLDDLLELTRLAADRLPSTDPLVTALKGARAQVLQSATPEP
jgi:hypothetical protein